MGKQLPKKWVETELNSLCNIQSGGTPSRGIAEYWNGTIPWVKISDITSFYVNVTEEYITEEGLKNSSAKMFAKGTILFTIFATIGKISILNIDATTNQAIVGITQNEYIHKHFLIYALQNKVDEIILQGKGVAQNNINMSILKERIIPLPPLAEQERIAEKLDALFGQLDSVRGAMSRIPTLLANLRQQILTHAVTGKLTHEWRQGKNLEGWKPELADECCIKVQSGGTPKGGNFSTVGIPFLKVYNIVQNKIDFEYQPQYVTNEIQKTQIKKSITYPGDVIMNIVGPPLNKIAIIPSTYPEWNLNQAITLFRTKDYLMKEYLYYFFCEGSSVNSLINETRGVVGQVNISLSQCRAFIIDIPPKSEQEEIVNRVQSLFEKLDSIEQRYQMLKTKLEYLPQAILHKAFKGELVEQLPTDGNATDLLHEIEQLKKSLKKK